MNELEALAALRGVPHLGPIKIRLLLQRFGSALEAIKADLRDVAELPGFGEKILKGWKELGRNNAWEKDLQLADRLGARLIPFTNPLFPKKLLELADHPVLLYVLGEATLLNQSGIAIVGTRHPSIYGLEMAEKFGYDLALQGLSVVSGLARGIDTAAHKGALRTGKTVAVIGSGLADIYPQENRRLAQEIASQGALVSEFPMATPPDRQNFPQRNRIVSGITRATLLIEAPEKSGAMITMEKGWTQGRSLFAIPGRADGDNFRGNHALIKQGRARLAESYRDILDSFLDLKGLTVAQPPSKILSLPLEKEEAALLQQLPAEEISLEAMEQLTKLPIRKLNVLLMSLMLKHAIKEYPGKRFKKAGIA